MIEQERDILRVRVSEPSLPLPSVWVFRDIGFLLPAPVTRNREKRRPHLHKRPPAYYCQQCQHLIAQEQHTLSIAGLFRHTFINPSGVPYQIGCFSEAGGCFIAGEPTSEYTWFPGYSWSYALCFVCLNHLGWFYQSPDHSFFGLILNRLSQTT